MDLVNTECRIGDCITLGSLDSPYYFLDDMYHNLTAKKHTVSEFLSLNKLGYRQNEMTEYFSQ